jgi:nucleoside-diphosphate-sugar epimerase
MKIAVTGAGGFLGRYVVEALQRLPVEVIAVSRRSNSPTPLAGATGTSVTLDLAQDYRGAFDRMGRPDVLVHLAWGGLPNYRSPDHLTIQLPLHIRFLRTCIEDGLESLIVAGTCLEYGMQEGELHETLPSAPATAYASAKDRLRQALEDARKSRDFQFTWLRIFYLFGPGQSASSLHSQLRAAVEAGKKSFDMSPGDQQRDFISVDRAAAQIATLALRDQDAGIVNLCSGVPSRVMDQARAWLKSWGASIELVPGVHPYPDYEPHAFWGSRLKLDLLLEGC